VAARAQWWKNGDHPHDEVESAFDPEDGRLKQTPGKVVKPYVPAKAADHLPTDLCPLCGQAYSVHGKVGRTLVHPGDWIITHDGGKYTVERPVNPAEEAAAKIEAEEAAREKARAAEAK
jgi:hypothetical protein